MIYLVASEGDVAGWALSVAAGFAGAFLVLALVCGVVAWALRGLES